MATTAGGEGARDCRTGDHYINFFLKPVQQKADELVQGLGGSSHLYYCADKEETKKSRSVLG